MALSCLGVRGTHAAFLACLLFAPRSAGAAPHELGVNIHQSATVGPDVARDAKLSWVRIDVNWLQVEPASGTFDWTTVDPVVDAARTRGLRVLAVLAYTPTWASSGDTKMDGPNNDVPLPGAYAAFVSAAVTHLAPKVTAFELWNEPNLGGFFEGTPADYTTRVLVPGADALHAACATCLAIGPGLATIGAAYDAWMDASLTAAKDKLDVVSGHIYASFSDLDSGAGKTSDSFFNKLEAHRVVKFGTSVVYEGPRSFKEVMDAHRVTKPFWITEAGRVATFGDAPAMAAQTTYYRHVLEAMLTRAWWTNAIFYEGFDVAGSGYTWGLSLADATAPGGYRKKPVMDLLSKAIGSQPGFGGNLTDCNDGLDNDADGLIDYPADPDCASASAPSEGTTPGDAGAAVADGAVPGDADGGDRGPGGARSTGCAMAPSHGGGAWLFLVTVALLVRRRVLGLSL